METDYAKFTKWLREHDHAESVDAKVSCSKHGRRYAGIYNYKTWQYECLHCLKAEFDAKQGSTDEALIDTNWRVHK